MTINHTVGTRHVSSASPTRLIFLTLAVISLAFILSPAHAQADSATLYPGTYQAEDARINSYQQFYKVGQSINKDDAEFGTAITANTFAFNMYGTAIMVRWRADKPGWLLAQSINNEGGLIASPGDSSNQYEIWQESFFHLTNLARPQKITLYARNTDTITIDSVTVFDRTAENLFPYIAAVAISLGMTLFVLISALRERWRR